MKRLFRLLWILVVILCCAATVCAAEPVIEQMNVRCDVDKHGDYVMTVTADVRFTEPSGDVILPIGTDARKISVSGYEISRKKIDGNTWVTLKDSAGLNGLQTFVISYEKLRAVTPEEDKTQTLDVELLCPLWDWSVKKMAFAVNMPEKFEVEPIFSSGYYAEQIAVDSRIDGATIQGTVRESLLDRESVDLTLQLPKRYFRLQNIPGGEDFAVQMFMLLLTVLGGVYWFCTLRNPRVKRTERDLTPEGILAWEFPYVSKGGGSDLPLLLSEWGSLGYISLAISQSGRIRAYSRIPMAGERKPYEVRIYRALFRREDVCFVDTARFHRMGEKAEKACRSFWNSQLFTKKSGNPNLMQLLASLTFGLSWFRALDWILPAWTWRLFLMIPTLVVGVLAGWFLQSILKNMIRSMPMKYGWLCLPILIATGLLAQLGGGWVIGLAALTFVVLTALGTFRGGKRTADGLERIAQIWAFKRYIRQVDVHHLQLMLREDGQYFYDLLPYAEALGMGKRFAERFGTMQLEPCVWLDYPGQKRCTAIEFYEIYCDVLRQMRGNRR